ncbi:hypothetical protein ACFS3C_06640 [Azotobacter vinelandii]
MQTFHEQRGSIRGKTVAWIGDGNNMCNTYIEAAHQFDFQLRIACPEGFDPPNPSLSPLPLTGYRSSETLEKQLPEHTWSAPTCGPPWARKRKRKIGWRASSPTR